MAKAEYLEYKSVKIKNSAALEMFRSLVIYVLIMNIKYIYD